MLDILNPVVALGGELVPSAVLALIEAGAEEVDRGLRSLEREVIALGDAGILSWAAGAQLPGDRWRAAGADADLYQQLWAIGRVSLPLARLFEGHVDALGLVWRLGSEKARWTAQQTAMRGGLLGVWGADQPGNAARATPDNSGGVMLGGGKAFASGLGLVRLAVVTARDPDGMCQLLLLPADDATREDTAAWDMDGMVGTASGRIALDGVRVPQSHLLGAPGALFVEPHFHGGLWRIAAVQAGALEGLARALLACLQMRQQDQDPVQRQRLAQVVMEAATADHWAQAAASSVGAPGADPSTIETALFAREAVEQAAVRALEHAERAAGTAMHARSGALSRIARDLRLYLRQASLDAKLDHALDLWRTRAGDDASA